MQEIENLRRHVDSTIGPEIPGVVLAVTCGSDNFLYAKGNIKEESQFFIASATKLYVTALILQLVDEGQLQLNDKITKFLKPEVTTALHIFKGINYTDQITISDLLSHTSGLPDYFQATRKSGRSLMDHILNVEDQKWDFDQVISDSKKLGAVFPPSSGKALYSDTNYQILGKIVESLRQDKLANLIDSHICKKLNLSKTYLYQDKNDTTPVSLNYKQHVLRIPQAMSSFGPDGGLVSTAAEGVLFLQGFFEGKLFDKRHLDQITKTWRNIFFPLKYGVGISLFRLPWYFSPFKKVPDLIGHSGLSGAFLFYCPQKGAYLAGTVNQISKPQTSFKLMIKAVNSLSAPHKF